LKNSILKFLTILVITIFCEILFWNANRSFIYPIKVSIEMKNGLDDLCQLFYDTGTGFNEGQVISETYQSGEDFSKISFRLPQSKIRTIRIDPGNNQDTFFIKKITIQVGSDSKNYSASNILNHFKLTNLIPTDSTEKETLTLVSVNNFDAQMMFSGQIDKEFVIENQQAKKWLIRFLIIFYVTIVLLVVLFGLKIYDATKKIVRFISIKTTGLFSSEGLNLNLKNFLIKNDKIIIASILIAIAAYGYELFNFTLTIDEELDTFRRAIEKKEYILNGRWGAYLLNLIIIPTTVLPFFPTFLALMGIALSSVLFVSHENTSLSTKLVFSAIFISSPAHAHFLAFSNLGLYFAFGMSLASMSFLLLKNAIEKDHRKITFYTLSIVLLTLAISMYQAMFAYFLVFCAYYLFAQSLKWNKINWHLLSKILVGIFVVCVSGILLYKIFDSAIRYFVLGPVSSNDKQYLDNFILWGKSPTKEIIINLINIITKYFTGWAFFRQAFGQSLFSIIFFTPMILIFIVKNKTNVWAKILSGTLLFAFILSAFSMIILNGNQIAARTLMSIPLMIAILWLLVHNEAGKRLRKIMVFVAIVILINNTYINTRLFYSANVSWEADRAMANRIVERIYALDPPLTGGKIPVAFIGMYRPEANELFYNLDILGMSFFSIGSLSPGRTIKVFNFIGDPNLELHYAEQDEQALNDGMPCWPAKGSVKIINEVVYVKLSEIENQN